MTIIELVTSLSPSEKGHFTIYTGNWRNDKQPKYVQLFHFINNYTKISDVEITRAGYKAADKNFLKEKIEESLHDLYLGKSVTSKLKWLTESMERYFKKQQWANLKKCISKTIKIAQKHEQYLDWLQAIYWEKEMLVAQPESRFLSENLENLYKEEKIVRLYLSEEINYCNLKNSLYALIIRDVRLNNPENKKKFDQLVSSDLLGDYKNPISKKSQIYYFYAKTKAAQYGDHKEKAYQLANKLIAVFDNNPTFKKNNLEWYKRRISLLCEICDFSNKIEEIPALIKIIGNDDEHFKIVCLYGLMYCIKKVDRDQGVAYLKKIKTIIENKNHNIRAGRQLAIFYNGAVFWSFFSNWKEMDYWIQKIIHFQLTDDRRDLQYAARILSLFNHFELQSDDMDNQIQAVDHYFKRNNQNTETNKYVIKAFWKLYRAINHKAMIPIWNDLKEYLEPLLKKTNKATRQLGIEELSLWCTSKIENISMGEAYKTHN